MESVEKEKKMRRSRVMYDGSEKVNNRISVYAVAFAKLAVDAILIFFFYDKLKQWNIFGNLLMRYIRFTLVSVKYVHLKLTFREFWIFFAVVFAILYLFMMTQIQVRNKGTYLLFSLFYLFDAVFLMQPTRSLLLFAMLTCFLFLLRKETVWRYVLCGAAIFAYGWFMNRYLLLLIPIYVIVFIWRRSDRWGLRALLAAIVALCLLYQFSKLAFLPYARPDSTAVTRISNVFPEENIIAHISYYLINLLCIFGKLLFPFDVIGKCFRHVWILPFLQLVAVFVFLRAFWYQIDTDWKHGIRHRDVMTQDILVFLFSYVLIQAIYEPDYHTAVNDMMGLVPFYFYLLFESDHRPYKMRVERDFTGTCPIFMCHHGNEDYVYDCIAQAGKVCGGEKIILLGDAKNQGFCSNHYNIADYYGEEVEHFREIYTHLSDSKPYRFELRCFERHFALYNFCVLHGIRECFMCDSDVLVFENLTALDMHDVDFACCNTNLEVTLGETDSPHVLYWKVDRLRQFLDFLIHTYTTETKWLEEVRRRENSTYGNANADINDMILLTAWRKISSQYDSTFRFRNLALTENGVVFDLSLTSPNNSCADEYVFDTGRKIKKLTFKDGIPYFTKKVPLSVKTAENAASHSVTAVSESAASSEVPKNAAESPRPRYSAAEELIDVSDTEDASIEAEFFSEDSDNLNGQYSSAASESVPNETGNEELSEPSYENNDSDASLPSETGTTESVRAAVLHCHSMREAYTVLLCKGVNNGFRYWIRRVVHAIL